MNIELDKNTIEQLTNLGNVLQTYDDVILKLIKHVETCDKFWNDMEW